MTLIDLNNITTEQIKAEMHQPENVIKYHGMFWRRFDGPFSNYLFEELIMFASLPEGSRKFEEFDFKMHNDGGTKQKSQILNRKVTGTTTKRHIVWRKGDARGAKVMEYAIQNIKKSYDSHPESRFSAAIDKLARAYNDKKPEIPSKLFFEKDEGLYVAFDSDNPVDLVATFVKPGGTVETVLFQIISATESINDVLTVRMCRPIHETIHGWMGRTEWENVNFVYSDHDKEWMIVITDIDPFENFGVFFKHAEDMSGYNDSKFQVSGIYPDLTRQEYNP